MCEKVIELMKVQLCKTLGAMSACNVMACFICNVSVVQMSSAKHLIVKYAWFMFVYYVCAVEPHIRNRPAHVDNIRARVRVARSARTN